MTGGMKGRCDGFGVSDSSDEPEPPGGEEGGGAGADADWGGRAAGEGGAADEGPAPRPNWAM